MARPEHGRTARPIRTAVSRSASFSNNTHDDNMKNKKCTNGIGEETVTACRAEREREKEETRNKTRQDMGKAIPGEAENIEMAWPHIEACTYIHDRFDLYE